MKIINISILIIALAFFCFADDWSQDAHDVQRTGYTAEIPTKPWTFVWDWNGADNTGGTNGHFYDAPREGRTITAAGKVFIPAGNLGLYANNIHDGKNLWQFKAAAIPAAPAYDHETGTVLAGGENGILYKLDPATGKVSDSYNTSSKIEKAVLTYKGKAWVVCENGSLHKVDIKTMNPDWVYSPEGSSQSATPPAFSVKNDCLIYATDSDLTVHAVNNSDGKKKWTVKPSPTTPGFPNQFHFGWPVIAEEYDVVLLRMRLSHGKMVDVMGMNVNGNSKFSDDWKVIRKKLTDNPEYQNLFVLNLKDGSKKFIPPVGYGTTEDFIQGKGPYGVTGSMPVIKTLPDGKQVAYLHFRHGDTKSGYDFRWDSHLGEMVFDSKTVPGYSEGDIRFTGIEKANESYSRITDEQCPLTMAGAVLFHAHWGIADGFEITDRSPEKGSSLSNSFITKKRVVIVRGIQTSGHSMETRFTRGGGNLCGDSRYAGHGSIFEYQGCSKDIGMYAPPMNPAKRAYSDGYRPRYTYVANGYVIISGNGGNLMIFKHSGESSR